MLTWDVIYVDTLMLREILNSRSADGWTIFSVAYNDVSRNYTIIMNKEARERLGYIPVRGI